ncbi:hypothetical protein BRADI_2g37940v3 [Brachypodium distachyon]|uniref:protein-serine/threonine phosphatase n=1 Tax=Brachypodium distachyon TaxID=15368 RepID=I1HMJ4_BRADI|nr:hypothetical protein BRADI_2g37940v3 [Brachypodium distachyon]
MVGPGRLVSTRVNLHGKAETRGSHAILRHGSSRRRHICGEPHAPRVGEPHGVVSGPKGSCSGSRRVAWGHREPHRENLRCRKMLMFLIQILQESFKKIKHLFYSLGAEKQPLPSAALTSRKNRPRRLASFGQESHDLVAAKLDAGVGAARPVTKVEVEASGGVGNYDGFSGPDAADYLFSNLYVAVHHELKSVLRKTDDAFFEAAEENSAEKMEVGLMGSCVLVMLMKGTDVYEINVGAIQREPDLKNILGKASQDLKQFKQEIMAVKCNCNKLKLLDLIVTMTCEGRCVNLFGTDGVPHTHLWIFAIK